MRPIEEIYKDLSGVDIETQKKLWNERGKGYYGEYLVLEQLYTQLPGNCKLLTNLQIPLPDGKSTEIDLMLIHETGVYVFEVKHYKGTIRGSSDDSTWVQYFRTAPSHTFRSPVEQNQYHIDALSRMFPQMPMYSIVVFTSGECTLEVTNHSPRVSICKLNHLLHHLDQQFRYTQASITATQIDKFFCALIPYSPMMQKTVDADGEPIPFHEYIPALQQDYYHRVQSNKHETDVMRFNYQQKEEALKIKEAELKADLDRQLSEARAALQKAYHGRKQVLIAICAIVTIVASLFVFDIYSHSQQAIAEAESDCAVKVAEANAALAAMEKNFRKVGLNNDGNLKVAENLVTVSHVSLTESTALANSCLFSYRLTTHSSEYGIYLLPASCYTVHYSDGTVDEISYWDTFTPPRTKTSQQKDRLYGLEKTGNLMNVRIYDHSPHEVTYIKFSNVYIYNPKTGKELDSTVTFDIELYNAETAAVQP